jgi:hypothetical protein
MARKGLLLTITFVSLFIFYGCGGGGGGTQGSPPPVLAVSSVSPASSSGDVGTDVLVSATFSDALDPTKINGSIFYLRDSVGSIVAALVSYNASSRTATLNPVTALAPAVTYTATVQGGSGGVAAADGSYLTSTYSWSFTTGAAADKTPPTVTSTMPSGGATGIPPSAHLEAVFSEPVNPATVSASTFELRNSANAVVTAVVAYISSTRTAILIPDSELSPLTLYSATIRGGTGGVADTAGNELAGNHSWSFTTGVAVDTTPPAVNSVIPNSGATAVIVTTQITAIFNEPLNASSVTTNTFELRNSANALIPATVSYNSGSLAAVLTPSAPLANSTTYSATLKGGPGGISDAAGNALASNYSWTFTTTAASGDTIHPTVNASSVYPVSGSTGSSTYSTIRVPFSEGMNAATITSSTVVLRNASLVVIPATVSYDPATFTAKLQPLSPLALGTVYTVSVSGVTDIAGNVLASNYSWSFTTSASSPYGSGPGGPILIVTANSNPFSRYYAEILAAEGLNEFAVQDISSINSTVLADYDIAILGNMPLTSNQVSLFANWVTAGGRLVAMRPDKQLAGLLGLTDAGTTLAEGYILADTGSGPGKGIVGETIQYHGTADRYTLNGATSIATLYSTASVATANPAVTLRSVGTNGGQAAAFTYDLARSIVYTRQGNPAWAGQERDGSTPLRSDDLFYPDWVNLNKVAIPQADEQQRLVANLIIQMNFDKKPLPRFWYFPDGYEAVVVMTGDDHGADGTAGRFDGFIQASQAGCSVNDWDCLRHTSYIVSGADGAMTNSQAMAYNAAGFEIGLHVTTGCADYTQQQLQQIYTDQLNQFKLTFPGLPTPVSQRTHCIAWSGYTIMPEVEYGYGVRMDVNYYYWPGSWIANRPGLFTGSGMPMRFAKSTGEIIDVYQAATQMTDESEQTYPYTVDTLLDKALGVEGYYGAFTANIHTDNSGSSFATAIVDSAVARGVPVISARQLLQWVDGRNGSYFESFSSTGTTLNFSVTVGQEANGLQVMLPLPSGKSISSIRRNGASVGYTLKIVKGQNYAIFSAISGDYSVTFAS